MIDRTNAPATAQPSLWDRFAALVDHDGSVAQPILTHLSDPRVPHRDLADALHCLCLLHGRDVGMIAVAHERADHPVARQWFEVAAEGFGRERDWLSRLIAGAGPLPSTPGQAETESVLATQRHALEMLAQSERPGVAIGAAAALVRDWYLLRPTLEAASRRLYVEYLPATLPAPKASQALLETTPMTAGQERSFLFGAQQLLAQQRGMWSLVDARRSARDSQ